MMGSTICINQVKTKIMGLGYAPIALLRVGNSSFSNHHNFIFTSIDNFPGTPIADNVRQEFIDNLLNIYEELETSFSKQLYLFYKGFEFRSLWNMDKKMAKFQRRAATLTKGSGHLQGVTSLTKALQDINNIEMAARSCFTTKKPKIGIYKWSFDKTKDPTVWTTFFSLVNCTVGLVQAELRVGRPEF